MIFDEATSALDVTSERIVQTALDRISQDRTTIVIAHRLSTIKDADQIVVIAKGQVVQQGVHNTLLENQNGAYWKLVNAQQLTLNTVPSIMNTSRTPSFKQDISVARKRDYEITIASEKIVLKGVDVESIKATVNIFQSFAMLLIEQRSSWKQYVSVIPAAMGAACEFSPGFRSSRISPADLQ